MTHSITLRIASPSDAPAIQAIYAPYVRNTAITFEYEVPSVEEFQKRISTTLLKFPYLIAEQNGVVAGFAYAAPLHTRPACDWAAEASVYVQEDHRKFGIGTLLYEQLEKILKAQGYINLNASIADTDHPDPHLPRGSIIFHEKRGFREVGRFHQCGYKLGSWYDLVWMEKHIGTHKTDLTPPIPFSKLRTDLQL